MRKPRQGYVLIIKAMDRLGRNYKEILDQWRIITNEKQVHIVVINMPLLGTRQREGIAVAKLRGVRFGRPRKYLLNLRNIKRSRKAGKFPQKKQHADNLTRHFFLLPTLRQFFGKQ